MDLVLTRTTDSFVSNVSTTFYLPSDHAAVTCNLDILRPEPVKIEITMRKLHDIDLDAFRSDILNSPLYKSPTSDLDLLVSQYNTVLNELKDKHAPLIERTVRSRPNAPWYNENLRAMKREMRRLERRWRSTNLEIHKQLFKDQSKKYYLEIKLAKQTYHQQQFADCDSKQLFKKFNKLCTPNVTSLPTDSDDKLAKRFSEFFSDKIQRIKKDLVNATGSDSSQFLDILTCESSFAEFSLVTEESVRDIIMKSPSSSCSLDPIPTWLLKKCVDELVPIITKIINLSFSNGTFPDALKSALIKPLIKKPNLDNEILKNYRPVANLTFIAKTIERASASQIHDYLVDNNLHVVSQRYQ